MAQLDDADLAKILGANFRQQLAEAEAEAGKMAGFNDKEAEVEKMDNRISLGIYTALVGILMIWAGVETATGGTWYFQVGLGIALLIAGVGSFVYYRRAIVEARLELAGMRH